MNLYTLCRSNRTASVCWEKTSCVAEEILVEPRGRGMVYPRPEHLFGGARVSLTMREIVEGVHQLEIPMRRNPLGKTYSYLLRDASTLIDTGIPTKKGLDAL